ncbi:MAG: 3-deoxy-manno-octulosonate-8-phosphatase KdsC [Shewanella sp.]
MMQETFYGPVAQAIWDKASAVKLLICDVDGVFSDGRIYLGNQGEELKAFHTRDGFGIKSLLSVGIQVAIITGRKSNLVAQRMSALGIEHIYQGVDDKHQPFTELLAKLALDPSQVAYIGDDVVDLPVMQHVGLSVCVADGHPFVKQQADWVTHINGGYGAVRELTDLLLLSQDKFHLSHGMSV